MSTSCWIFDEYISTFEKIGYKHPIFFLDDGWYIGGRKVSVGMVIQECNIPEDEAIMLKLTYGY